VPRTPGAGRPRTRAGSTRSIAPMTSVNTELVLVALAAMLSPTTLFLSVLVLVVGERPMRAGLWFYLGAFGVTLVIGIVAAFVLGNSARLAEAEHTEDMGRHHRRDCQRGRAVLCRSVPPAASRSQTGDEHDRSNEQGGLLACYPAIIAAGATLAIPGAFIPVALKDISETNPSAAQ